MRIAQSALIGWLLDRSLAIDIENAHLYIEKLLQIGVLTKSALFRFNNIMFIHKNKIPEDPEDDEHYSRQRMHESVTFPFKNDNGIIVVRKSAWQKYPANHKCRLGHAETDSFCIKRHEEKVWKKAFVRLCGRTD